MIYGIGIDLCEIARIEKVMQRFGARFMGRVYHPNEIIFLEKNPTKTIRRAAMLFAAKEAVSKALGTGFRQGVFMRDIEVYHEPSGRPNIRLWGNALKKSQRLCSKDSEGKYHPEILVSLSDDGGMAGAYVILQGIL